MDKTVLGERDLTVDLEGGGNTSDEDGPKDTILGTTKAKKFFSKAWNGSVNFDGFVKGEEGLNSCNGCVLNSADVSVENVESLATGKMLGGEEKVEKDARRENPRKKSCKKPPKPPRPPKSPLLDAADQKLVREITEVAMLKRARIERMKALKKMKVARAASSSSSNLCAMVITILFCLVIILQGVFSRGSSHANFQGSPESAVEMRGGLISVQYYRNAFPGSTDAPGSESPNIVEQVSGVGTTHEEWSRARE